MSPRQTRKSHATEVGVGELPGDISEEIERVPEVREAILEAYARILDER